MNPIATLHRSYPLALNLFISAVSASNSSSNGHESSKSSSTLDHNFAHILYQLSTPHAHSESTKSPKESPRAHPNTHPHHEPHLDPVETGWLAASMTSRWCNWHLSNLL
eukprot:TRINITY_DN75752_c0_g1_i1.p1 TRINITY_DN75752_c0_g1~~TRINITY_DN75752_c0_g1_i1.p1  ORF type:complete len:109 (+),score=17.28 TRINITY_DN75752_c0_g1_i1:130-456(+)